jgi:D-sedoheptulose 7-phosphate isomerase
MFNRITNKNLKEIKKNLNQLNKKKYINLINETSLLIIDALKNKQKIIFCGNGGSSADALHFSAEFLGRYLKNRQPFNSLDLNSNIAAITAISNDYSFEDIFSRQLLAIGQANDILFAVSTSGKSKNIIKAIKLANKMKIKVILMTSKKGNKLENFCDIIFKCPGTRVDRIQEMQKIVGHLICENVEKALS